MLCLADAWDGSLQPLYNYMSDLPSLEGEPAPIPPRKHVRRVSGQLSNLDLGRGCPLPVFVLHDHQRTGPQEPVSLARRSRASDSGKLPARQPAVLHYRRQFRAQSPLGTALRPHDPIAGRRRLEDPLHNSGGHIRFTIQVDTLCHRIPNFIEKAAQAGVRRVFIGLENINPDNLLAAKKRQNKITEYRALLQKWHEHGAITCAGYIIGFPGHTRASILLDIEIIKRELPLDVLELFMLTPLPGSEDHKTL
jgi:hypothetical protein